MSIEIDARGLTCPQPLLATKQALAEISTGVIVTLVDKVAAKENVVKFAKASGCGICVEEQGGNYLIRITKGEVGDATGQENPRSSGRGTVYLITQDTLGHGSEELGAILMKACLQTMAEAELLPQGLLLINSGVRLAVEGAPVLAQLQALAAKGVDIQACGTCLDYFNLKDKLAVGGITNMYTILSQMSGANKAVTL